MTSNCDEKMGRKNEKREAVRDVPGGSTEKKILEPITIDGEVRVLVLRKRGLFVLIWRWWWLWRLGLGLWWWWWWWWLG